MLLIDNVYQISNALQKEVWDARRCPTNQELGVFLADNVKTTRLTKEINLFWNCRDFSLVCAVSEKARHFQNKQISLVNPVVRR